MSTDTQGPERTIGQLVADAAHDVQGIVRSEIALAKAEMTDGAKVMGKGAGLLGAAAFLGIFGLGFLLSALARLLDLWLPQWAAWGIVALLLLVVAGILAAVGAKALKKAKPVPEKAIAEAKQTMAAIKP